MPVTWIAHVSDTHFATKQDKKALLPRLAQTMPPVHAAHGVAPFIAKIRNSIVQSHGCSSHVPRLFRQLLDELKRLHSTPLAPQFVVHSGDVSQAGQLDSMDGALAALKKESEVEVFAIAGNHDVWPEDFPPFAAGRTGLQLKRVRQSGHFATSYSHVHPKAGLDLILLDSAVSDSLLNTTALGSIEHDLDLAAASYRPQLPPLPACNAQVRIAVMHHPPQDLSRGIWSGWRKAGAGMVLIDDQRVRGELVVSGVQIVMCGHEHRPPPSPQEAIIESDKLLMLQAGCPTLWMNQGNNSVPQFSLYQIDDAGGEIALNWYICELPRGWRHFGHFVFKGGTWKLAASNSNLPKELSQLPPAPFRPAP